MTTYLDGLTRMRLERGARHLHQLGERATLELLLEVADATGGLSCIADRLGEYSRRLTPEMVRLVGGDRFPSRLPREVPR